MSAKKKYRLPGCIVLLAAVIGTRQAYDWAMANIKMAISMEDGK